MATILKTIPFDAELLPLVSDFNCAAEQPPRFWEEEINEWIRMEPVAEDGALFWMEKGTQVWLYANEEDEIVGYGSLCESRWPDPTVVEKRPKIKRVPISLIPAVGLDNRYQGCPEGAAPDERYSTKILRHLIREACKHSNRQPFLGLYVHPQNEKAIRFYRREHFEDFSQKYWHEEASVEYLSMILKINDHFLPKGGLAEVSKPGGCMASFAKPRTLFLTERRARRVRLSPVDVAFLLEHHRGHMEVLPSGRRDCYRLTALGCVGVLIAPRCRLVIRPKIPLANVFALLDPLAAISSESDSVATDSGTEILEFLAGQLARRMAERVAAGLHRVYREQSEQGPVLHGRLDIPAQLREAPGRKDQLHSRYEELSADGACHRVVKATAEGLMASPLLSAEVRLALQAALTGFVGVSSLPLSPRLWDEATAERMPEEYHPLLDLCRLLADVLLPRESAGQTAAPSFLLDLERAFERHVARSLVAAFAHSREYSVAVQRTHTVNRPVAGQNDIVVRPDAILEREGRTVWVVDAKWKRWPHSAETGDLYQMLAYGATLGAEGVALVYPGKGWRVREYRFTHTALRLRMYALPVGGMRAAGERAVRRLARDLRLSANTLP